MRIFQKAIAILTLAILAGNAAAVPWRAVYKTPGQGNKFLYMINNRNIPELQSVYVENLRDGAKGCYQVKPKTDIKTHWKVNAGWPVTIHYFKNPYCFGDRYAYGTVGLSNYVGDKYVYFVL